MKEKNICEKDGVNSNFYFVFIFHFFLFIIKKWTKNIYQKIKIEKSHKRPGVHLGVEMNQAGDKKRGGRGGRVNERKRKK